MRKKKILALGMAAVLALSGMQSAVVSAADFPESEVFSDESAAGTEETVLSEQEPDAQAEEASAETEIFTGGEPEELFGDGAEVFTDAGEVKAAGENDVSEEGTYLYDYPCSGDGQNKILVGEDIWIQNSMYVYICDSDAPDGRDAETAITNVEILDQATWNEDGEVVEGETVIELSAEEDGWNLHGRREGIVNARITYESVAQGREGQAETHDLRIFVENEYYELRYDFPDHRDTMLTNSTKEVSLSVIYRYTGIEGSGETWVEDCRVEIVSREDGTPGYDTNLIRAEVCQEEYSIWMKLNSFEESGDTDIEVRALGKDENGNEYELCCNYIYVNVTEGYYDILPTDLLDPEWGHRVDPQVGESLDIRSYNPSVCWYQSGQAPVQEEDVRFYMEYDSNAWRVAEGMENDSLPTLIRRVPWGTDVTLIAEKNMAGEGEEECWEEIARRNYWFDGMDYEVRFEEIRSEEDGYTWLYSNEDMPFGLRMDSIPEGAQAEWTVGCFDDTIGEVVPYEGAEGKLYTVSEDGNSIILHGAALREQGIFRDENWFDVTVDILYDGQSILGGGVGVCLEEPVYDYYYYGDENLLPGQSFWIEPRMGVEYENAENPWGDYKEVQVTGVKIIEQKEWTEDGEVDAEDVVHVETGDGWNICADKFGYAVAEISYETVAGDPNPGTYSITLRINGERWGLELVSSIGDNQLLPGAEMDLTAEPWYERYEESQGILSEEANVEVVWGSDGEGFAENMEFEVDSENSRVCHVKALKDATDAWNGWSGWITATVYLLDEEGNRVKDEESGEDIEVAWNEFRVSINTGFTSITPAFLEKTDLKVGETLVIAPQIWQYYRDPVGTLGQNEFTENVKFRWEWNPDAVEITDADGKVLSLESEDGQGAYGKSPFTVKKLRNWDTNICVIAEETNYNDEIMESGRRDWGLQSADYSTWIESPRGGQDSAPWVFSDEDFELGLSRENLGDSDFAVEWQLGFWNEEIFEPMEAEGLFTQNPDDPTKITLHGAALAENREFLNEGEEFFIRYRLIAADEEVYSDTCSVNLRDPDIQWDEVDSDEILGYKKAYADNQLWTWIMDKDHPDGELIESTIKDISSSNEEVIRCYRDKENNEFWTVEGVGIGSAELTFTMELEGREESFTVCKTIAEEIWRMELETDPRANALLPNGSLKILLRVNHYTPESEELLAPDAYQVEYESMDEQIVTVKDGIVQAGDVSGYTEVLVRVLVPRADGDPYVLEDSIPITVEEEYLALQAKDITVEPGSSWEVKALYPVLMRFSRENPEGEPVEASMYVRSYLSDEGKYYVVNDTWDAFQVTDALTQEDEPVTTDIFVQAIVSEGEADEEVYNTYAKLTICAHVWGKETGQAPTCTGQGYLHHTCKKCGFEETKKLTALKHSFGKYVSNKDATCLKDGTKTAKCTRCGVKNTVTDKGSKLKAKLEVPTKTLPLKTGQKLTIFKVTMAKGDSVVSWKSSNTKIVKVSGKKNGTCTLTAGKKTGTAKITIKLKSKKSVTIKVKVQKNKVKTTEISGIQKKITLKKGKKLKLNAVITPISSSEKVTYSSSNKKVATVSSKGEIKAKKKGKAEITIKSGKKTVKCMVTVR